MLPPPRRARLPRPYTLARLALGLLLLAGGAEILLRQLVRSPVYVEPHPHIGMVGRPHAPVVASSEGWVRERLNSRGLVDREADPAATQRWLLVGDSFTQAVQLPFEQAFGAVAERAVPGLELVNVAGSGTSPASLPALLEEFGELGPDGIVLQVSDHDVVQLFQGPGPHLRPVDGGFELVDPAGTTGWSAAGRWKFWLMQRSALVTLVVERLQKLVMVERARLGPRFGAGRQAVGEGGAPDARNAAAAGFPRSAAALDWLLDQVREQQPRLLLLYVPHVDYGPGQCAAAEPARREFWAEAARRHRIPFVDPTDAICELYLREQLPSHGFHNTQPGEGHLSAAGHRVLGELLAAAIAGSSP